MLEFSLVAFPLLLLGVLIIEAAHWHTVRQLAYVALLDSARAGATQHGRPDVMEQAFAQAMLPRFVDADEQRARDRQRLAWSRVQRLAEMPPWRIEIRRPDEPHMLTARLTYLHEPLTPLMKALIRRIARFTDSCIQQAWTRGFLAIRLDLRIERHSASEDWRTLPISRHDRVVYGVKDCSS